MTNISTVSVALIFKNFCFYVSNNKVLSDTIQDMKITSRICMYIILRQPYRFTKHISPITHGILQTNILISGKYFKLIYDRGWWGKEAGGIDLSHPYCQKHVTEYINYEQQRCWKWQAGCWRAVLCLSTVSSTCCMHLGGSLMTPTMRKA